MEWLYEHFVQGMLDSGLSHFGGEECYNTIPLTYHVLSCLTVGLFYLFLLFKFHHHLENPIIIPKKAANLLEKFIFLVGIISYIYTF